VHNVAKEKRKDKEEKYDTNIESAYLSDDWADLYQIWNGRCPTMRDYPQQKWFISVVHY